MLQFKKVMKTAFAKTVKNHKKQNVTQCSYNLLTISSHTASQLFCTIWIVDWFAHVLYRTW